MTKLTNELRSKIIDNALKKAGMSELRQNYEERLAAWREAVRLDAIGGKEEERKLMKLESKFEKLLEAVPKKLRDTTKAITRFGFLRLNLAGQSLYWSFDGPDYAICPANHTITGDHPLAAEFLELQAELSEIKAKEEDIRSVVGATLYQFTTLKKLIEAWPEVTELLPLLPPATGNTLPMVPVAQLNKLVFNPINKAA